MNYENQNKDITKHEVIIFGLEHYNPLGAIRSLGQKGINPTYITVLHGRYPIATKSRYIKETIVVENFDEGLEVLEAKFGNAPKDCLPIVLTCDDKAMEYLDKKYEELRDRFIIFNAGENGRITKYMDKFEILKMAEKHGLKILRTETVDRGVIPEGLEYPIITKAISPNAGAWKGDVFICENEDELKAAYQKIKSEKVLLQKYINKKNEFCIDGFTVNNGTDTVITIACTYKYLIKGYYSPYMDVANYDNKELEPGIKSMLEDIGYDGIWCIEFLVDQDDNYYFTEVNFRNSGWSYVSTKAGMNMPYLWIKSFLNGKIDHDETYTQIRKGFTAMVEPIDYQKRVVEKVAGDVDLAEWLKDFKETDCGFYYDDYDTEPFYDMIRNWTKLN